MADEVFNPIETLTPGQVLAESTIAEYIKAMGLSIAAAQKALDFNSLSQVGEYTEARAGLGGKSLLQLGLSPPFYHFQHADVSVSLQLSMRIGKDEALGIGAKVDLGIGGAGSGGSATPTLRSGQIKLKKLPASVSVDGNKVEAIGADLEAAAESVAKKLRKPIGKFDRVYVASAESKIAIELDPPTAANPLIASGAVAFLPAVASSSALIRVADEPTQPLTFTLNTGKTAEVLAQANQLEYAKAIVGKINAVGGFKAMLVNDQAGGSEGIKPGAVFMLLFETGSSVITAEADNQLREAARLLKAADVEVDVVGFADRQGFTGGKDQTTDAARNLQLGQNRAITVASQLQAYGVNAAKIRPPRSEGEDAWKNTPDEVANSQYRRVELRVKDAQTYFIVVDAEGTQTFQTAPSPDKRSSTGTGFIAVHTASAQAVDGLKLKVGSSKTEIEIKGDAVNSSDAQLAASSPAAYAHNLTAAINAKSDTHKARAVRRGGVVYLTGVDDVVTLDLITLSTDSLKLAADGGASVSTALPEPKAATKGDTTADSKGGSNVSLAVGLSVDYRESRRFDQSVNGNSSISAHLVAVPAPIEFLEEIRKYLAPATATTTPTTPTTPTTGTTG